MSTTIRITNPDFKQDVKVVRNVAMADVPYKYVIGGGCPTDIRFGRAYKDIDIWTNDPLIVHDQAHVHLRNIIEAAGLECESSNAFHHPYQDNNHTKIAEAVGIFKGKRYVFEMMTVPVTDIVPLNLRIATTTARGFQSNVTTNFIFKCDVTNRCMMSGPSSLWNMMFLNLSSEYALKTIDKYLPYFSGGWRDSTSYSTLRNINHTQNLSITPLKMTMLTELRWRSSMRTYLDKHQEEIRQASINLADQRGIAGASTPRMSTMSTPSTQGTSSSGSLPPFWLRPSSPAPQLQPNRREVGSGIATISTDGRSISETLSDIRRAYGGARWVRPSGAVVTPNP